MMDNAQELVDTSSLPKRETYNEWYNNNKKHTSSMNTQDDLVSSFGQRKAPQRRLEPCQSPQFVAPSQGACHQTVPPYWFVFSGHASWAGQLQASTKSIMFHSVEETKETDESQPSSPREQKKVEILSALHFFLYFIQTERSRASSAPNSRSGLFYFERNYIRVWQPAACDSPLRTHLSFLCEELSALHCAAKSQFDAYV
jgi:hypothetical protein